MKNLVVLQCDPKDIKHCTERLLQELNNGSWVQLVPLNASKRLVSRKTLPIGPGVVVLSSGSSGSSKYCFQPCKHLDESAHATAHWLGTLGLEPKECLIFNPLPLHHVSGLMPLWRSKCWGAEYVSLGSDVMRQPNLLEEFLSSHLQNTDKVKPRLISLVPIQLSRLMSHPLGMDWLRSFSVIWVGGDSVSSELEGLARKEGLRLAPCYGATETAAMIAALSPNDFLSGQTGCGRPLHDIELSLASDGALLVRTSRLAIRICNEFGMEIPCSVKGWWRSADKAQILGVPDKPNLQILGRMDLAVHSGGETVFPEYLEEKLFQLAVEAGLPIENILFLPQKDSEWGHRLKVLVRWQTEKTSDDDALLLQALRVLVGNWLPSQKPVSWHICPGLARNETGKWDRARWTNWLKENCE